MLLLHRTIECEALSASAAARGVNRITNETMNDDQANRQAHATPPFRLAGSGLNMSPRGLAARITLAAAVYCIAGLGSRLLQLSSGHSVSLWPAAGCALAALLVWGARCWPGVWLGAFAFGFFPGMSATGALVSALTACGATMQALLGAHLTRSLFDAPVPLGRLREVGRFLLLAGPLSCLISATLGVAVRFGSGQLEASALLSQWLVWLKADTLGVLLFAPLALMVWPGGRPLWVRHRIPIAVSLIATSALLVAGSLGWTALEKSRARAEIASNAEEVYDSASRLLVARIESLHFIERYMTTSDDVSRREFSAFTDRIQRRSGTLVIGWLQRVEHRQRAAFEAVLRRDAGANSGITERAADGAILPVGPRATYYPVYFAAPAEANRRMIGFDYGPQSERALAQAGDTGSVVISALEPLAHSGEAGVIVLVPQYTPDFNPAGASIAARRAAVRGFALGIYQPDKLFAPVAAAAKASGLQLRVTDITAGDIAQVLTDQFAAGVLPTWSRTITFGNRLWRVDVRPAGPLWQPGASIEGRIYLGFSVLGAFLITFIVLSNAGRRAVIEAEVAERSAELEREFLARRLAEEARRETELRYRQLIDAAPNGIFVHDQGKFVFVNPKAVAMFGARSASELLGRTVLDVVHPDSRDAIRERMRLLTEEQVSTPPYEATWLRSDGAAFFGETSSVPYQHDDRPGSLTILLDVTARREAEAQRDRIFDLSRDLMCIAGTDGYFKRINPAFTRTLGWSAEELLTRPYLDYVHPEDVRFNRGQLRDNPIVEVMELKNRYRCKDGSWRWVEWKLVPAPDGFIYATGRDITPQQELERKLLGLNTELKLRVDERSAALAALQAKREEVRAIVDNLREGVITIDVRGTVQSANPALERLLGYSADQITGRNVSMLMPAPHRGTHVGDLDRFLRTGEARVTGFDNQVQGRHRDGSLVPLELSVNEYLVNGERFFVGSLRDVRERQQLIAELTSARTEAENASRAKSAFLATMSHEIRTPMNGVIGMADVLLHSVLPDSEADMVRTIHQSSFALLGIIDDILDFSKIEAGRLELERKPVSIAAIAEGIGVSLSAVAAAKSVDLSVFVSPLIPEAVLSDELRLRQVLYNLVGNAVKFSSGTPQRRGRVTVRVEPVTAAPLRVALRVADNGIGIAPEAMARLFQAFSQAEVATTRRFGGTGLGLAICKRLVGLMGGQIEVASTPGHGATFTVNLPFVACAQQPDRSTHDLAGLECIVVASPAYSADDLAAYLEHAGARVHRVADEASAGPLASALPAPVVVVHEAAQDGFATADGAFPAAGAGQVRHLLLQRGQRLRAGIEAADIVSIGIDGLRRQTFLRAVAEAGGRCSPELCHDGRELAAAAVALSVPSVAEARARGRLILVAEDDEINQKVILKQLGLLGYAAEVAGNGVAALQLWRAGRYALLLTDLHMPEMDGYQLAETIRREQAGSARMPILAITANALRGEEVRARDAGMDDYLTKPIQLKLLRAALEQWLPSNVSVLPAASAQAPADTRSVDVSVLEGLVGTDPDLVREFLVEYLDAARRQCRELHAARSGADIRALGAIAHRLKSASRSVGALALGDVCAQLENACKADDKALIAQALHNFDIALAAVDTDISALLAQHSGRKCS